MAFVDIESGVRLHVQRLRAKTPLPGPPPTVVFIHGLVMDNLSSWYFTVANAVASAGVPTLLYDLRGHGRSSRPATGYDLDAMVGDLLALLDAEGQRQVTLVGNSFGGLVAIAFAAAHPERVAGLALVDAHLSDGAWGEGMAETLSLKGDARDAMIAAHFKSWLGRHSERKRNRLAHSAQDLIANTTLVDDLRGARGIDDATLRGITAPTLAYYGADSDIIEHGQRLAALVPNCTLTAVPDATHSVIWEATDAVRTAIVAFACARTVLAIETAPTP